MLTVSFASVLGFSLILIALIAVFFSPYRHWLGFMFAGMVFWGGIEMLRFGVESIFQWSLLYSYLAAISVVMLGLLFALLRLGRLEQQQLANRQLIEHTPIYDDEK
ncbi:hypothetical protein GCM10027155_16540 [Acinetobacter apis]|uniref:Uncharacterized protein n=1 Tax=Acinetobacter apis TaxID=1229165 RepID=A0A217EHF0_9GAMM|nr:AciT family ciprofloxacin tolerance protein [Acinetobacter apis]SNQ29606.1 hypothetical protein SAMN05444584_1565 [Acinetobacter apis]